MKFAVTGKECRGTCVVEYNTKGYYVLKMESRHKHEYLSINTCARDEPFEKEGRTYKYIYKPMGIEKLSNCPVFVSSYNRKEKNDHAVFAIRDDRFKLKANQVCNGKEKNDIGVGICQTKEGLIQEVMFDEPVKIARFCNDKYIFRSNNRYFRYNMPNRICKTVFRAIKSKKQYLLITIGYEERMLRKI